MLRYCMFRYARAFDSDLSGWDVSKCKNFASAFEGCSSFNRRLDGAWSRGAPDRRWMFQDSPGGIEGMVKDEYGTPQRA